MEWSSLMTGWGCITCVCTTNLNKKKWTWNVLLFFIQTCMSVLLFSLFSCFFLSERLKVIFTEDILTGPKRSIIRWIMVEVNFGVLVSGSLHRHFSWKTFCLTAEYAQVKLILLTIAQFQCPIEWACKIPGPWN